MTASVCALAVCAGFHALAILLAYRAPLARSGVVWAAFVVSAALASANGALVLYYYL